MRASNGGTLEDNNIPSRRGNREGVDCFGGIVLDFMIIFIGYGDKSLLPSEHDKKEQEAMLLMINKKQDKNQQVIFFNKNIINRSMDPRPYHFDYRRPRINNPTYLSKQIIDRIQQKDQRNPSPMQNSSLLLNPELKRASSTDINTSKINESAKLGQQYSRDSLSSRNKLNNSMANYGRSLLGKPRYEQQQVFERQERRFNIISYWPRTIQPHLKEYPKLTMEDKLLESGINQQ